MSQDSAVIKVNIGEIVSGVICSRALFRNFYPSVLPMIGAFTSSLYTQAVLQSGSLFVAESINYSR
jgi:hypothetical protein